MTPGAAVGGGRIFATPGRVPEVHELGPDGRLIRIMRVAREPEAITRTRFDTFVDERVAREDDPADAAEVRRRYAETPMRERMPAYGRLLVDADGNVWAERYRANAESPATWTIFGPEGEAAGRLTLPERARILAVGNGRVLAVRRDDMDVEHLVAWPLVRIGAETGSR